MSYKNVTCVCEKNEIEKTRKEKNQSRKAASPAAHNLFGPAQWVCHERRIISYVIPILYKWRGWIEADHSNQTCIRGWVMTCNMSHVSLNWPNTSPWPGSKCDQSLRASHHLWTNTKSDGTRPDRPSLSCLVRNLLDIVKWCQVRSAR